MISKISLFVSIICFSFLNAQELAVQKKIDSVSRKISTITSSDSVGIAKQHYRIGNYYQVSLISDSAYFYYYKAEKVFRQHNKHFELARTLFGIAVLQTFDKDYTGSEITSFEAISMLDKLPQINDVRKYKAYIYNNLGIVFDELDLFDDAIGYFETSLSIKQNLSGNFERSIGLTLNNMLKVYRRAGLYEKAFSMYEEISTSRNLTETYPTIHISALGNFANALFRSGNYDRLPDLYFKALNLCDSVNDTYNTIILNQYLAEYYKKIQVLDSAKFYAYKSMETAKHYANDDLLKSFLLVSGIESGETSAAYLKKYINLNDSIQKAERRIRNKSARIRFETQKLEQQNIRIARERFWLIIVSVTLLLSALLIYIIISQRAKNKALEFSKKQQDANEEIYNLMLGEHEKIEEARTLEKKRISQELHDGVLGRLFGTRLSLDSLNLNTTTTGIKARDQYIRELKTIEDDIRKVSHELNTDFIAGSGFIDIITNLVKTQTKIYKLNYSLNYEDDINWETLANKYKIHIYRITQEALHNIYKHAKATKVDISFVTKNNVICLSIKDDGVGFDTNKAKIGIGLKNMKSRINEFKGEFNIISEINAGTTVTIELPLKYHEIDGRN